ncbi:MAG: hypothetical protein U0271_42785 [Polyangiaceae bacterium]
MAGGAFAGLMIANKKAEQAKAIEELSSAWSSLVAGPRALAFGGPAKNPSLTGAAQGTGPITISIEFDHVGMAHTRIRVVTLAKHDFHVGVYPNPGGIMGFLKSHLGEDLQVDDELFDDAFIIKATPPEGAIALLQPTLRERIQAISVKPFTAFTYSPGEVNVQIPDVEKDAHWLEAALDAALDAARWDPTAQAFR